VKLRTQQSSFELEALEPRLLLSADALAGALAPEQDTAAASAESAIVESLHTFSTPLDATLASAAMDIFEGMMDEAVLIESAPVWDDAAPLFDADQPGLTDAAMSQTGEDENEPAVTNAAELDSAALAAGPSQALLQDDSEAPPVENFTDDAMAAMLVETLHAANAPPGSEEISEEEFPDVFVEIAAVAAAALEGEAQTTTHSAVQDDAAGAELLTAASAAWSPLRPMLVLPGIAGTFASEQAIDTWITQRGIHPDGLQIDPLAGFYYDILRTLENAGYTLGVNLFAANYDWRVLPGPDPKNDLETGLPIFDGVVRGVTAESITDGTFTYGIDYLGYWLVQAMEAWAAANDGEIPATVDIIAHSTGGLVARTYIQSEAYNGTITLNGGEVELPKVHDLIMVGAPNRGASKAWSPLHNNFAADPAYRVVLSKVMSKAYALHQAGVTIDGPSPIFPGEQLSEIEFIDRYVPTIRGLLATYPFYIHNEGTAVALKVGWTGAGHYSEIWNRWLIDLNDGLDALYQADEIPADRDPSRFLEFLTGSAFVLYSNSEETPVEVKRQIGPVTPLGGGPLGLGDEILPFDRFFGGPPGAQDEWFRDIWTDQSGDGTVPTLSAALIYLQDARFGTGRHQVLEIAQHNEAGDGSLSHTGIMSNIQAQKAILDLLGAPYVDGDISTTLAFPPEVSLLNAIAFGFLNPEELLANTSFEELGGEVFRLGIVTALAQYRAALVEMQTTGPLAELIPLVNITIGEALGLDLLFETLIAGPIENFLRQNPNATTDAFVAFLKTLGSAAQDFYLWIDSNRVAGGWVSSADEMLRSAIGLLPAGEGSIELAEAVFVLPFEVQRTLHAQVMLSELGFDGIFAGTNAQVQIEVGARLDLVFGYDMRPEIERTDRPFVRTPGLTFYAKIHSDDAAFDLTLGILGAGVQNGRIDLDASVTVAMTAPNDPRGNLTASVFSDHSIAELASMHATSHFLAMLPVSVQWGGWSPSGSPAIEIEGHGWSTAPPEVRFVDFDSLLPFTNLSVLGLIQVLEETGALLGRAGTSELLNRQIPLVEGATIGQVLGLQEALGTYLTARLVDENGRPRVENIQQLIPLLNSLAAGSGPGAVEASVTYNQNRQELVFQFAVSYDLATLARPFHLQYEFGALTVSASTSEAGVGGGGSIQFDVIIGLSNPRAVVLGEVDLPANGRLSSDAVFELFLNGGVIQQDGHGEFGARGVTITLAAAATAGNTTRAHLLAQVQAAIDATSLAGRVEAQLQGNRLVLATLTRGTQASLRIEVDQDNSAATELGLRPRAQATDSVINRASLDNVRINGAIELFAAEVRAVAGIGFLGIIIRDGSASLDLGVQLDLTSGGRVGLNALRATIREQPLSLVSGLTVSGTASVVLRQIEVESNLLAAPAAQASITITAALNQGNLTSLDGAEVAFDARLNELFQFQALTLEGLLRELRNVAGVIRGLLGEQIFQRELPLLGQSLAELLDLAQPFLDWLDQIAERAPRNIQDFARILDDTLEAFLDEHFPQSGRSPESAVYVSAGVLRIDLGIFFAFAQEDMRVRLSAAAGDNRFDRFFDASGESAFSIALEGDLIVKFGVDLAQASQQPGAGFYLYGGTKVEARLKVDASDIAFRALVQPFGVGIFVQNGVIRMDDGTANRKPMAVTYALNPSGGRVALTALGANQFQQSVLGKIQAGLPLFFPTKASGVGSITVNADLQNLAGAQINLPSLEQIFGGADLADLLAVGLDLFLDLLHDLVNRELFSERLPFIGDGLLKLGEFLAEVRGWIDEGFGNAQEMAEHAIREALYAALSEGGGDILLNRDGDAPGEAADIFVVIDRGAGGVIHELVIDVVLGRETTLVDADLGFDIGLPGLSLELDGGLTVNFGWEFRLIFGYHRDYGFFIDVAQTDELKIMLEVGFSDAEMTGRLAFMELIAGDHPDQPSGLTLGLTVDLLPAGGQQSRLTVADLSAGAGLFDARALGEANLNLELVLAFAGVEALPSFHVDFLMGWTFVNASVGGGVSIGSAPEVRFQNARIHLGSFFDDFIRPIADTINAYLEPLDPLISFLTADIGPLNWNPLNRWLDQDGDGKVTLLDLAQMNGTLSQETRQFIETAVFIRELIADIDSGDFSGSGTESYIHLGDVSFAGLDLRAINAGQVNPDAVTISAAMAIASQFAAFGGKASETFSSMTNAGVSTIGGGFNFLLFDPKNLVRLILGHPVEFFQYTMPRLVLEIDFRLDIPIWYPPQVSIVLEAGIKMEAGLSFGYDSTGIERYARTGNEADIFGGFYVLTGPGVPPQLLLSGFVGGGIGVSIYALSATGTVRLTAEAALNLVDPGGRGKLYLWQMASAIEQQGLGALHCFYQIEVALGAAVKIEIAVLGSSVWEILIGPVNFAEFSGDPDHCPESQLPDRLEEDEERLNNDFREWAADIGVAPGIHLTGTSISSPGDIDWYKFELVNPEQLTIRLSEQGNAPHLMLLLTDERGTPISSTEASTANKTLRTSTLLPGTYYIQVASRTGDIAPYDLSITPGRESEARVIYVNSPDAEIPAINSFYTLAPGNDDDHDGLSPHRPLATFQAVLDLYVLGPNDYVLIDSGTYWDTLNLTGSNVSNGVVIAGAPGGTTFTGSTTLLSLDQVSGIYAAYLHLSTTARESVTVSSSDNNVFYQITIEGAETGVLVENSSGNRFTFLTVSDVETGVRIEGSSNGNSFENARINASGTGMVFAAAGSAPDSNIVSNSEIEAGVGILVEAASNLRLERLFITASERGIELSSGTQAITVIQATIRPGQWSAGEEAGILVEAGASGEVRLSDISGFAVGVRNDGHGVSIVRNQIHGNQTGMTGLGRLGPASLAQSNDIFGNEIGIRIPADGSHQEVSLNRIYENEIGILSDAPGGRLGGHHLVYFPANELAPGQLQGNASLVPAGETVPTDLMMAGFDAIRLLPSGWTLPQDWASRVGGSAVIDLAERTQLVNIFFAGSSTLTFQIYDVPASLLLDFEYFDTALVQGLPFAPGSLAVADARLLIPFGSFLDPGPEPIRIYFPHQLYFTDAEIELAAPMVQGPRPAVIFGNEVFGNRVGIVSSTVVGGPGWMRPNLIYGNDVGIISGNGAQVRFNEIFGNGIGIEATGSVWIHHNLLYNQQSLAGQAHSRGIWLRSDSSTAPWFRVPALVENNTIHTITGRGIEIESDYRQVTIQNNILWAQDGYNLYLTNRAEPDGFGNFEFHSVAQLQSNYNNLYTSGNGKLAFWYYAFDDLYHWQIESGFDLNSIGTTSLDAQRDNPRFVNPAQADYRLQAGSTSIAAGNPESRFNLEPGASGGRVNLGAYGNTATATPAPERLLRVEFPELHTDWTANQTREIAWHQFNISGDVRIELRPVSGGPAVLIAQVPAGQGSYAWKPQDSGIQGSMNETYRIAIVSVSHAQTSAISREPFTIPVPGSNYYVNDGSMAFASFTSAAGDHRNSGRSPDQPKASVHGILESYDLLPGDIIYMDAGHYLLIRNITLTSEHAGLTLKGNPHPTNPAGRATLERASTSLGSFAIDLFNANDIRIEGLAFTGGRAAIHGGGYLDLRYLIGGGGDQARSSSRVVIQDNFIEIKVAGTSLLNFSYGILARGNHQGWVIEGNRIIGNPDRSMEWFDWEFSIGLDIEGTNHEVRGNTASHFGSIGLHVRGTGIRVENNLAHNNQTGILADGSVLVRNNVVRGNDQSGILLLGSQALAENNQAWGNGVGISLSNGSAARFNQVWNNAEGFRISGASTAEANEVRNNIVGLMVRNGTARGNEVHGNQTGIVIDPEGVLSKAVADGNRVFANSGVGIIASLVADVLNNQVYSNRGGGILAGGVEFWGQIYNEFQGRIHNNLIYANDEFGIRVFYTSEEPAIFNNTVHQASGPALWVEVASGVLVRNNIFWVQNGPAIRVEASAQPGFDSDRNLFYLNGSTAHAGFWNGAARVTLANWQAASALDELSVAGNPLFLGAAGSDGVLGFRWSDNYDGGRDDNFRIGAGSPAIDRGETAGVLPHDKDGNPRYDDPNTPNLGSSGQYGESLLADSFFTQSGQKVLGPWYTPGVAIDLPFAFPYFDEVYEIVFASEKGFLQFGPRIPLDDHGQEGYPKFVPPDGFDDNAPTMQNFLLYPRIAPMWDNIAGVEEIGTIFGFPLPPQLVFHVDQSQAGQVTIRWVGENEADGAPVNFSVTLFESGEIEFHYGAGNSNLAPIVGLSQGGNGLYVLGAYHGSAVLTNAASVRFAATDGFNDLGAYEFQGPRDVTPPAAAFNVLPTLNRGTEPLRFQIVFSDNLALNIGSIVGNHMAVQVNGPNGFSRLASFVSISQAIDGTPRTATYAIAAPEGGWTSAHSGAYTIVIRPGQIQDSAGNLLPGGSLATFTAQIEGSAPVAPNYDFAYEAGKKLNVSAGLGLLSNALPGDGSTLAPVVVKWPARGILVLNQDGSFSYTPQPGFSGLDSFTYKLNDGLSESELGTVRLSADEVLVAPRVTGAVINQGAAQRSMVWSIGIVFNAALATTLQANHFQLFNETTGATIDPTGVAVSWNVSTRTATLTFPGLSGGSLADGRYRLTISGESVIGANGLALDGNGDGTAGGIYTFVFHRFFGDASGNGRVDNMDGLLFRAALGKTSGQPGYLDYFDAAQTGAIGQEDRTLFMSNLGQVLSIAPQVTAVIVNGGDEQRSMVRSVEVTFSADLAAAPQAGDLRLFNRTTGQWVSVSNVAVSWDSGTRTATLTFPGLAGGTLADGIYALIIPDGAVTGGNGITLDGNGDGLAGGMFVLEFHSLFGDTTGNARVDNLDGLRFRAAFGSSAGDPAYVAHFDAGQTGGIGVDDRNRFMANFGSPLDLAGLHPVPAEVGLAAASVILQETSMESSIVGPVMESSQEAAPGGAGPIHTPSIRSPISRMPGIVSGEWEARPDPFANRTYEASRFLMPLAASQHTSQHRSAFLLDSQWAEEEAGPFLLRLLKAYRISHPASK
jgi:hypothetical protein